MHAACQAAGHHRPAALQTPHQKQGAQCPNSPWGAARTSHICSKARLASSAASARRCHTPWAAGAAPKQPWEAACTIHILHFCIHAGGGLERCTGLQASPTMGGRHCAQIALGGTM